MGDVLSIGEVAARSGVATSALRFYEDEGLIASERTDSGHRRYPRAVIRRIAFIVFAQKIGLSLEEIRRELAKAAAQPRAGPGGLVEAVRQLDDTDRRENCGTGTNEGRPYRVHRVRMPVARSL